MLRVWDFSDATQHLAPVDLFMAEQMLDRWPAPRLLEFGVWKGGWILSLLAGCPDAVGVGVDPYPGAGEIREGMLASVVDRGLDDRFTLLRHGDDIATEAPVGEFDLVHIDGEHSEAAVDAELAFATRYLADDGVVIVDDYRFSWFPGVASALFGFVKDREWAIFLCTENKAYLCRAEHHERWLATVVDLLTETELPWSRGLGQRYPESTDVRGFPMALCLGPVPSERVLEGRHVPLRTRWTRTTARWAPPLRETVRPMKRRLLRSRRS